MLVHASTDGLPDESEREEFAELSRSAGAVIAGELVSSRRRPDPRYFIGKGKLDELRKLIEAVVVARGRAREAARRSRAQRAACRGRAPLPAPPAR